MKRDAEDRESSAVDVAEEVRSLRRQVESVASYLGVTLLRETAAVAAAELEIVGVEQTQAIQFFRFRGQGSGAAGDNSIPMTQAKTTFLRVYVARPGTRIRRITGSVSYRSPSTGNTVRVAPIAPIAALSLQQIDRREADDTLTFRINARDCMNAMDFKVDVADAAVPNTIIATTTVRISFREVPALPVYVVRINFDRTGLPTEAEARAVLTFSENSYPSPAFRFTGFESASLSGTTSSTGCGPVWSVIMKFLRRKRAASNTRDIYVGIVDDPMDGVLGCGGGGVAAAHKGGAATLAQEIGHGLGRGHAAGCRNPGGIDPNFPRYANYPRASIGEFGYDPATNQIFDPEVYRDFMSYCSRRWVSPYTYMALRSRIINDYGQTRAAEAVMAEYLHVSFQLPKNASKPVTLMQSFHVRESEPPHEHDDDSDAEIVMCMLRDADEQPLVFHYCRADDTHGSATDDEEFYEIIRWDDRARTLVVYRGADMVGTPIKIDAKPPKTPGDIKVEIHGQLLRITWKADGSKDVTYVVRFSFDGGETWRAFGLDVTGNKYEIPRDALPVVTAQFRVQVIATSGLRSASAETGDIRFADLEA